jgi:hypothetical protein
MLIVPYKLQKEDLIWTLWIFLSNGLLWETDEEKCSEKFILENYLTPNGFFGKGKIIGKTFYFELNEKTNISNFYTWTDFLEKEAEIPKVDLFRPFVWVGEALGQKDDWGWYEECEQVSLGKSSLLEVWTSVAGLRE